MLRPAGMNRTVRLGAGIRIAVYTGYIKPLAPKRQVLGLTPPHYLEIKLPAIQIDPRDAHGNRVAETVGAAGAGAFE